jgi:hypothetical protein
MHKIIACLALISLPVFAQNIPVKCIPGSEATTKLVTHYYVPLLEKYNHKICDLVEGTCIYKKSGKAYLHNYGYKDELLSTARCKNGYGNQRNCLNPCRTLAASTKYHKFGQIVFIPELVGKHCGNLKRDGFEMVHDGFMVVGDTGSPTHFNAQGRFDYFWGRCQKTKNHECLEGPSEISNDITGSPYCTVWDPSNPNTNQDVKSAFVSKVKAEAAERGDAGAVDDFNL